MPQTSINTFFRNRKRSASEFVPSPDKLMTKKLFALDDGSSSPIRSPVVRRQRNEDLQVQRSLESVNKTCHLEETESAVSTHTSTVEKESSSEKSILAEFKKSVRNSKKYPVLKAALKKYNTTVSLLEKLYLTKFDVPSSRHSTASVVEIEAVSRQTVSDDGLTPAEPCFARFKHLAAASPDILVLPSEYVNLEDLFNGVEAMVWTLLNRKEVVTFKLIQNNVQELTRKKFTEQHMGMIKTVYPDAYELRYGLIKLPFSSVETLDIIIEKPKSNNENVNERKKIFRELLLERTKLHHQEFLETLNPPLVVPMDQIRRWHPLFDLNSVPSVSPTPIPRLLCNNNESDSTENAEEIAVVSEKLTESNINLVHFLRKALNCVPKLLLVKIRANKVTKI